MKLCVLTTRLQEKPKHSYEGLFLYNITLEEYRKCILKGMVSTDIEKNAYICYLYSSLVLKN